MDLHYENGSIGIRFAKKRDIRHIACHHHCCFRCSWLSASPSIRSKASPSTSNRCTWKCSYGFAHCSWQTFVLEWFLATDKKRYIATHFIFLLVAIPYQNIIAYMGWTFSPEVTYMLRFIPLVRGGYAMAIVVGWLTYNRASGLFVSYLTMLLATVYFSSLAFYVMEHGTNPLVTGYGDALWWAFMDVTTVGSNIIAVTVTRAGTVRAAGSVGHDDVPHFHSICNEPGRAAQQGKARLLQKDRTGTDCKEHSLIVKAGIFLYPPGTTAPKRVVINADFEYIFHQKP